MSKNKIKQTQTFLDGKTTILTFFTHNKKGTRDFPQLFCSSIRRVKILLRENLRSLGLHRWILLSRQLQEIPDVIRF